MSSHSHAGDHLSAQLLEELARGERTTAEVLNQSLPHLASRCPVCRGTLEEYSIDTVVTRLSPGYAASIARAKDRFADVARERAEAPERVAELLDTGGLPEALATLTGNPRFQTWGVAAYLLERAEAALEDAPRAAHACATLAIAAGEGLPRRRYGSGEAATIETVAVALLASARILAYRDVRGAEAVLVRANDVARAASDTTLTRAELALARMTIDLSAGEYERAIRAFGQVETQVARGGLPGHRLRALLLLGRAHRGAGDPHRALGSFRLLAQFASGQPRYWDLGRWGTLETSRSLCDLGRVEDALAELKNLAPEGVAGEGGRGHAVRDWLRGRALWRLGSLTVAVRALERAWSALLTTGTPLEAAAAALELAELHLGGDDAEAATDVLERAFAVFQAEGFPRWAAVRLLRLQRDVERGDLDRRTLAAVREELLAPNADPPEPPERVN